MFASIKTHEHSHDHHRQEAVRRDSLPFADNASRCPLCDNHCSLNDPGCRKGASFALQQAAAKGNEMTNENIDAPETTPSGETLTELFRRALKAMSRAHHSQGSAQYAQAHVLAILREKESMSQRELMETLNVRSSSLSEILEKLERNSFIARARSDQDKRNFIISVTEQGRALAEEHKKEYPENAEAIFAPLSAVERQQLRALLEKIITPLEKDSPEHDADTNRGHGFGHRHGHGHHKHDEEHGDHAHRHGRHGHGGISRHGRH